MTETIKVEVDESLARRFRKKAMEKYGYKKGSMKKALEEAMMKFSGSGGVDWEPLMGALKLDVDSVELQHSWWKRID